MKIAIPERPSEATIKPVLASLPPVTYYPLVRADVMTKNGTVYTKECLERAAANFKAKIRSGDALVFDQSWAEARLHKFGNFLGKVIDVQFDGCKLEINVKFNDFVLDFVTRSVSAFDFYAVGTRAGVGNVVESFCITGIGISLKHLRCKLRTRLNKAVSNGQDSP